LHQVNEGQDIRVKRGIEVVPTGGKDGPETTGRRITDQDVKLPDLIPDKLDHTVDVVLLADIGLHDMASAAESHNLFRNFDGRRPGADVVDHDVGSRRSQTDRTGAANPARTTRY
jgi:hypothetical protein